MTGQPIEGSVIIITGASSGIGAAAARLLAGRGARVVLAARRVERLEALAAELIAAGGAALALSCDVRERGDCQALVARTLERWGRVDVLVNNAGLGYGGTLGTLDEAEVRQQVETNLLGATWCADAVVPAMRRQRRGLLINLGSVAGSLGLPTSGIYCATKFALEGLSQAMRCELSGSGVSVALLCPGFVETEFHAAGGQRRQPWRPGPLMSAEYVAERIARLIERPRRKVVISWPYQLVTGLSRLLPGLTAWILALAGPRIVARRQRARRLERE